MADLSPNVAIIALKASSPNITIKRKRLAEQIKEHEPIHAVYKKIVSSKMI